MSVPSVASRFVIKPLAAPTLVYPPNDVNLPVEDVVMDWAPVPGAKASTSRWPPTPASTPSTVDVTNIQSTRYSPTTTYDNNQYWWRVRAVDLAGQSTRGPSRCSATSASGRTSPGACSRSGTARLAGPRRPTTPYFQWTPVQHASSLRGADGQRRQLLHRTSGPARRAQHDLHSSGTLRRLRLRHRRRPPTGGSGRSTPPYQRQPAIQGIYSDPRPSCGAARPPVRHVRHQLRAGDRAQDRHRRSRPGRRATHAPTTLCDDVPATPVLRLGRPARHHALPGVRR